MYPPRLRVKRPILRSMLSNPGVALDAYGRPLGLAGFVPTSASSPIRCWGPAWDRSCKVCVPLPNGGESCTSFKVNDVQRSQGDLDIVAGDSGAVQRFYAPRGGYRRI